MVVQPEIVIRSVARPKISVIVVNVNVRNWLERCLRSLVEQDIFHCIEVVVVDNGSSDGSCDMVKRMFPCCKLVQLEETVAFGVANNIGARYCTAPILLFLNPDTLVCAGSLNAMLHHLEEHPKCGAAGGTIFDGEGNMERSIGSFPSLLSMGLDRLLRYGAPARKILGQHSNQHWVGYDKPHTVDWVTGAYLWTRKELFERVGGFDKHIFMYCEDVELCYRIHQLGFEIWFFPKAPIIHYRGKSLVPRSRKKMLFESLHYFANKHYKSPRFWLTRSVFWIVSRL